MEESTRKGAERRWEEEPSCLKEENEWRKEDGKKKRRSSRIVMKRSLSAEGG